VSVREKLAFDDRQCSQALRSFAETYPEAELAILSTCNRTEMYLIRPVHSQPGLREAIRFLAEQQQIPLHEFTESIYHYEDGEAVRHLFRVVSSLDSMVVGESGILAQAKHGLQLAKEARGNDAAPRRLASLFQKAFWVAKEVHTRTGISAGRVSVGSIAVEFARQIFSHFNDKVVLMVGAGKMGELTLRHLLQMQPKRVLVTNRTAARAEELAARIGAEAQPFDGLVDLVTVSDIVLSCTGSPDPIITRQAFSRVPERRRYRPLLLIDMAVPRDVDPGVGELQGVFVYNIDDLQRVTEKHAAQRKSKIAASERIVEDAVIEHLQWEGKREVGPVIAALNARLDNLACQELEWLGPKIKDASERDRELIRQMLHRLVKKILHDPTRTLHSKGQQGRAQVYAETMWTLFDLESEEQSGPRNQAED
jgi:glutamyl-tRNA reductase